MLKAKAKKIHNPQGIKALDGKLAAASEIA
jgi:hypothetical protein